MLPIILAIIGAFLILFVLVPVYVTFSKQPKYKISCIAIKALTTGISFVFALIGFLTLNKLPNINGNEYQIPSPYWALIGLGLCLIADVFLCINLVAGGVFFFLGHLAYIAFFLSLGGFHTVSIIIYTLLCVATLCYFYRYTAILKRYHLLFVLYAMTILATVTLGLLLPYTYDLYGFLPACASLLLVASDFLLARNKLLEETPLSRIVALNCYFMGQYLMAMTLYIAAFL
jgi:uncharacterized membrane protein YhhN